SERAQNLQAELVDDVAHHHRNQYLVLDEQDAIAVFHPDGQGTPVIRNGTQPRGMPRHGLDPVAARHREAAMQPIGTPVELRFAFELTLGARAYYTHAGAGRVVG